VAVIRGDFTDTSRVGDWSWPSGDAGGGGLGKQQNTGRRVQERLLFAR
jgi:hypothetical protein